VNVGMGIKEFPELNRANPALVRSAISLVKNLNGKFQIIRVGQIGKLGM
jgi:hypothetical protein